MATLTINFADANSEGSFLALVVDHLSGMDGVTASWQGDHTANQADLSAVSADSVGTQQADAVSSAPGTAVGTGTSDISGTSPTGGPTAPGPDASGTVIGP
jgi:hypothetical protein